ncbi:5719_t:CDS:1, partial [Funneliformis geosporum]
PLLIIFAATGTGKSNFAKRFSDRFIDGDDLIFHDSFSKDLLTQGRFDEINELARKRLGDYSGDKIIMSSYYLHLPTNRVVFHRMVHATDIYYTQNFIWNDIQEKYHRSSNEKHLNIAINRSYNFVDVNNFKEKDEAFLKFADELEKERKLFCEDTRHHQITSNAS